MNDTTYEPAVCFHWDEEKKIKMADSQNPRFPAPAMHYAWSLQNHGKDFFRTNMHTNVKEGLDKKLMKFEF